ncbi:MAG: hypothetical protein ACR2PA_13950, partial [Hyphomicrobiaceae bacterium]
MTRLYVHHRIQTQPRAWQAVSDALGGATRESENVGGRLYGIWRSQIGRPRDELNVITTWPSSGFDGQRFSDCLSVNGDIVDHQCWPMSPTLRPESDMPPGRQGNYAFRLFRTSEAKWDEFLQLCADAWPGFESSYEDCQVIGL